MASWATKSGSVWNVAELTHFPQKTLESRVLCHVARIVPPSTRLGLKWIGVGTHSPSHRLPRGIVGARRDRPMEHHDEY